MKLFQQSVVIVLGLGLSAGPAAAQAPDWVHELVDGVAQHAEALAQLVQQQVAAAQVRQRANRGGRGADYTDTFERTVRLGRNGTFDLQNISGDVVITGTGGDQVRITATKRVRQSDEAVARSMLAALEIRVVERSGAVAVSTQRPRGRNWSGVAVNFSVSVPRGTRVTLQSVSGSLRVTNVDGELRAESVSGDLVVSSAGAVRQAKTVSGDLDLSNITGDDVSIGTVSGDIRIDRLTARIFEARSVSGDVQLTNAESDRASLRSVSGDIDYAGALGRNGRYEFQSHSGDVRVTPDGARGFSLDATTFSGTIRSDYALTVQGTQAGSRSPGRRNTAIHGSFGDGGATLSVQSFSGDIVIARR